MDQIQNPQLHPKCECHACTQQRAKEMNAYPLWPSLDQFQQYRDPVKAQREAINGPAR